MGDMNETLKRNLQKSGVGYINLTTTEKESTDLDQLIYTDDNKMICSKLRVQALQSNNLVNPPRYSECSTLCSFPIEVCD